MGSWNMRLLLMVVVLFAGGSLGANELPRVLILGDSIYAAPAAEMARNLKGRAEVVYPAMQPGEVRNTATVLKDLDRLLGPGNWAVIHFNLGLGDIIHRAPGMESFRVLPKEAGGVPAVSPEEYRKNLEAIVARLRKTGATLIWASTTPLGKSSARGLVPGLEVDYNAIAAKVMTANGVIVNDLHAYVAGKLKDVDPRRMPGPYDFMTQAPITPVLTEVITARLP